MIELYYYNKSYYNNNILLFILKQVPSRQHRNGRSAIDMRWRHSASDPKAFISADDDDDDDGDA